MPNQYVNKVVQSNGTTLIDISDTTAVEADVASGKYFYLASGEKVAGTGQGGGGGSSAQIATGSVTGEGTTTLAIPCNFEPDLIYVYGDMSDSASNRGVVSITILKDAFVYMTSDSSTSNVTEEFAFGYHNISGYGDPTILSVTYSNGTLTFNTLSNTSSRRFRSGQTYTYKLVKWT